MCGKRVEGGVRLKGEKWPENRRFSVDPTVEACQILIVAFGDKPSKRCIKGIKRSEHTPSRDEQWYLCWSVLPFVYAIIVASEPEANRHASQKVYV